MMIIDEERLMSYRLPLEEAPAISNLCNNLIEIQFGDVVAGPGRKTLLKAG